ncbi:MAG: hypothetical protein MJZ29_03070 [Bacteroidaceae bacterium]|nr:hypothetical protein [Bacteroidaceae bacterium]
MKQNLLKSLWLIALFLVVGNVSAQDEDYFIAFWVDGTKCFEPSYPVNVNQKDMTPAEFVELRKENPNAVAVTPIGYSGVISDSKNIIFEMQLPTGTYSYECPTLVIDDNYNWYSPINFKTQSIIYSRQLAPGGINSVCLPFSISRNDLPFNVQNSARFLNFVEVKDDQAWFADMETVPAGTPCLLMCDADVTGKLDLQREAKKNALGKYSDLIDVQFEINSNSLVGSYVETKITGPYKYKVGEGKLVHAFDDGRSHVFPFRAYLDPQQNYTPQSFDLDDPQSLTIAIKDPEDETTAVSSASIESHIISEVFNINGVKQSELKKGVNIVRMSDGSIKKIIKK